MRSLILLLTLFSGAALAATESPTLALKGFPPLPATATKDMDCSAGEKMKQKVEGVTEKMRALAAAPAATQAPASMTPEQMTALQQLSDPAFTMCPIEAMQPDALDWQLAPQQKLEQRLAEVNAALNAAYAAGCEKQQAEVCPPPSAAFLKGFNAQAAAAGAQYLKEMQPGYAGYLKQVGACLELREKPAAAARGVTGAFGVLAAGADAQNWGLVGMVAEVHGQACSRAREAARTYAPE